MAYRSYRGFNLIPLWVIMGLNLVLFIATLINRQLLYLFGLIPADVLARPWIIVTSMFVHGGLWHILANMITLYFFGRYLCSLVGGKKFLIVYFVGGILGSGFYILLAPPFSIAIGASGAVFALGGALAVMMPRLRVFVFPIPAPLPLWVAVIGGFLILSLLPLLRILPYIAWQAHLGGLAFGLAIGYFFRRRERRLF